MSLTKEKKKEVIKEFSGSETNTGSVEAQIALFTERINHVSGHLKSNKKDFGSTRSLLKYVGQRKRLLSYLAKKDIEGYRKLIDRLKLRK
ncbi:MAG: 30S ribosomal protein S15 [Bacteroidia bacterium]|nr:30S ribosomal protein S15 [Bacteroidia bacterium]